MRTQCYCMPPPFQGQTRAHSMLLHTPSLSGPDPCALNATACPLPPLQGQTRAHSRLVNLLGVKQLIVGVNKMDNKDAGPYKVK